MDTDRIESREQLDQLAKEFRYIITDIMCRAGGGHIGGSLSLVDIIITLYFRILNLKPDDPRWEDRDRFILSKGHAGPTLYTALAYKGYFEKDVLLTLNANGTELPSHVDQVITPGIDQTAGSLGQGLSCANGIALANKPRLLLLDEPTAGMSPEETRSTVGLVEHPPSARTTRDAHCHH